jgi:hypothetical protein
LSFALAANNSYSSYNLLFSLSCFFSSITLYYFALLSFLAYFAAFFAASS